MSNLFQYKYNNTNDRWTNTGGPLIVLFVISFLTFTYFHPISFNEYIHLKHYSTISTIKMLLIPQVMFALGPFLVLLFQRKSVSVYNKLGLINWNIGHIGQMLKLELYICIPLLFLSYGNALFFNKLGLTTSSYGVEMLQNSSIYGKVIIIVFAVLVAPIVEELAFRRVLFVFIEKYIGSFHSAVLISIIFAAMHGSVNQIIPLTVLSLILCQVYTKFNSIYPSIFLHAFNNSFMIILFFLLKVV